MISRLQLLVWFSGISFLTWAFWDPRFRDTEGFPVAALCLAVAVGAALLLLGWAFAGPCRRFAFWLALALLGQAVSLQLIAAGPLVRWQTYKPFDRLLAESSPVLLLYIVVQTLMVGTVLVSRWRKIAEWIRSNFKTWQILGVSAVFVLSSAAAQRQASLYVDNVLFSSLVQIVNLGNVVLMAWALPDNVIISLHRRMELLFGRHGEENSKRPPGLDRFALLGAIWVVVLATALGFVSYQWHPHITDEVAYFLHARFLAQGSLTLPAPPVPEAFDLYLMDVKGDQWFSTQYPGWPAILAIGVRFGVPWLMNPLLAGLGVFLAYLLLRELYDRSTARISVLLLAVSPWYVFMAMNFMTHILTLTCALGAAVAVIQARKSNKARWAALAGILVGAGTLIRPLDGLIVAALVGLWIVGAGGRRLSFSCLAAFAMGAVIAGAVWLPYNTALTGHPTTFAINAYLDNRFGPGKNDFGFGPNRGYGWPTQPFPGHSPLSATINAVLNTFSMNVELFGWGTGSLILAALMLFSGSLRKSDYLMIAVCLAVFWPYFFYYFSGGPDFGARYWFLMVIPLVALTVRGVEVVKGKIRLSSAGTSDEARVMVAVLSLSLLALMNFFPWRAIDKYHHYWGMQPDVVKLATEHAFGKSLVLIRGLDSQPDLASAAIYNPLDWNADAPVYAWDRSPDIRAKLLKAFPDRAVWLLDGPSITGSGYRVVKGPLAATDLIARDSGRGTEIH